MIQLCRLACPTGSWAIVKSAFLIFLPWYELSAFLLPECLPLAMPLPLPMICHLTLLWLENQIYRACREILYECSGGTKLSQALHPSCVWLEVRSHCSPKVQILLGKRGENDFFKCQHRAPLVAQWYRVCLLTKRHRFDPWSGNIPHALEQQSPYAVTTEPVLYSPRAAATVPTCRSYGSPCALEPVFLNKRGRCSEQPARHN